MVLALDAVISDDSVKWYCNGSCESVIRALPPTAPGLYLDDSDMEEDEEED